jgi:DNA-binding transcriptional MerR regulator
VTRLEQQYAPYKGLTEQVTPDQVQNLLTFLNNYSTDPVATWLGLAQSLQEEGLIENPDFSVEQIQGLLAAQGQQPEMDMGEVPMWAQQMMQDQQGVMQYINQQQEAETQRTAAEESRQQEALLTEAKGTIRENLKASGIPEELVSDEQIVAALIVHKGDISTAAQSFTGLRDGFLKDFTTANANGSRAPTIRGGTPQAPKEGLRPRTGDAFREASVGAQQFLAQNAAAEGS